MNKNSIIPSRRNKNRKLSSPQMRNQAAGFKSNAQKKNPTRASPILIQYLTQPKAQHPNRRFATTRATKIKKGSPGVVTCEWQPNAGTELVNLDTGNQIYPSLIDHRLRVRHGVARESMKLKNRNLELHL